MRIDLELGASRRLLAYLLALYGLACVAVLASQFPWPVKLVAVIGLTVCAWRDVERHALRWGDTATTALVYDNNRGVICRDGRGQRSEWQPDQAGFALPWLVILPLLGSDGRRARWLVISPDAAGARGFHQLLLRRRHP